MKLVYRAAAADRCEAPGDQDFPVGLECPGNAVASYEFSTES